MNKYVYKNKHKYVKHEQKEAISTVHKELTRAMPICQPYLQGLLGLLHSMDMSEV